MFLIEKRDGAIKGQTAANGSAQRSYTPKEEANITLDTLSAFV